MSQLAALLLVVATTMSTLVGAQQLPHYELDQEVFLSLLSDLVQAAEFAQQPQPVEEATASVITSFLAPYADASNGRLTIQRFEYVQDRPNIVVTYRAPVPTEDVISFVGSHLDVVAADPATWDSPPFNMTIGPDNNRLIGRGVSDCLGNIALQCMLFRDLVRTNPPLTRNIVSMFIANEEAGPVTYGVGIDVLLDEGELDYLRGNPFYWVDASGFGPTLGSAGSVSWDLTVKGWLGHSGRPQNGINAIHLAQEAVRALEVAFYEKFPKTDFDESYGFIVGTNMKPTGISTGDNVRNQIPDLCVVTGDARVTPSYTNEEVQDFLIEFTNSIDVSTLSVPGYAGFVRESGERGELSMEVIEGPYPPAAVDLSSPNLKILEDAIFAVRGTSYPAATGGSLPIIGDLIAADFDVQITGFGVADNVHGDNEFGYLSDFVDGYRVFALLLEELATAS